MCTTTAPPPPPHRGTARTLVVISRGDEVLGAELTAAGALDFPDALGRASVEFDPDARPVSDLVVPHSSGHESMRTVKTTSQENPNLEPAWLSYFHAQQIRAAVS